MELREDIIPFGDGQKGCYRSAGPTKPSLGLLSPFDVTD